MVSIKVDTTCAALSARFAGSVPCGLNWNLTPIIPALDDLEQALKRDKFDKFDRYLDAETRFAFVVLNRQYAHLFAVPEADELNVQPACRDPKDNKFLSLRKASVFAHQIGL